MPMFIRLLFDFYFGRSDDGRVRQGNNGWKIDLFGAPAFVAQQSARRFPADRDVPQQFHGRGIAGVELGETALHAVDHWDQAEVPIQRIARLAVQTAHCCSHLLVGIRRDVLHQKIDQTRISLEDAQDLKRAILRTGLSSGLWRNWLGLS